MIETNTKAFWRATMALGLGSFMIFANVYLTHPLLPRLTEEFELSPLQAGWSLNIVTLTLGLSLLIFGAVSDAFGRRRLMLLSLALATFVSLLLTFADGYAAILALRALEGVFLAGLPAIAIAYMADEFSKRALIVAVGIYIGANALGGISGRLLGGFVAEYWHWNSVFLVMGLVNVLILAIFAKLLPPSRNFHPKPFNLNQVLQDFRGHLGTPVLRLAFVIGGFNFFVFLNQYSYITFVLADAPYRLSSAQIGLLFLTYLGGSFSAAVSGQLAVRWSQPLCIGIGISLMILGTLLTLLGGLGPIIAGFLLSASGFFLSQSMLSSWVSHSATRARASASSLYLVFYYLGASTGGLYLDPFWRWAAWPGVVIGSLLVLAFTLSLATTLRKLERRQLAVVSSG